MQEWLHNPIVQGGIAPFFAALIAAELLQRLRLSGLAIVAGLAATVFLVGNFAFEPLTAARKAILIGIASPMIAIALGGSYWLRPLYAAVGGMATWWVTERILQQQPLPTLLLWAAGISFYTGWLVYSMDGLAEEPVRAGSAALGLGVGTGISALFGASALLGLYGIALGAAAGAFQLIQMLTSQHLPCGRSFTLPLALTAALLGILALLTANLPWYVLPVLGLIPLAARIRIYANSAVWVQSILLSAITLACAAIAVYLTWRVTGAPPL